ncbi:hypothetical protein [Ilumatobacter sp.]|uniref:hypothetical protein n=1 Tax=Ilumatobacter sp. TaxID=1967498 RepID=UPI003C535C09
MRKIIVSAALAIAAAAFIATPAQAQEAQPSPEQELVEKYAPIVYLKAQDSPCDTEGEPYAPQAVDIVLDNPDIVLRQVGNDDPVIDHAPSAADLYGRSEGFYLDFPGSALAPGCIYEHDFDRYTGTVTGEREPVVYGHITTQEGEPDKLAVQYWFYWYYNDWNNKHEGDWEGIQLLFDVGTVEEALATDPTSTGYAQHEGGERADWDSAKLAREGTHPVVYPSSGSHASYYGSALYLGRSASEGFGCDSTDGPSLRTEPGVVLLPATASGPDDEFAWIEFDGRWGERQSGPFNGPTGPQDKERWTSPVDWHDSLRTSSAVVPAGDRQGESIVNTFCDVVERGSGALITMKTSPLRLVATLGILLLLANWFARRTVWNKVDALPMIARRRAGQIIRAAAGSYRRRAGVLITIGLVYLPVAVLVSAVGALMQRIPFVKSVTALAGNAADTSLLFALLAGGFANLLAFTAVNAMVAAYYDLLSDDQPATGMDAVRRAWSCAPQLFEGFLRAFLIVAVLLVSVIGIPFGIWYLIRFQFLAQAVVTEDRTGRDGLARSSELIRGRWWHTAIMIGLFNLLVGASGAIVGLLLLVLVAGIPLWLFSGLVTLVYSLIVPLAAVAQTLLFGDAVAEERERSSAHEDADSMVPA